ncbi:hypothetical protein TARUN_3738 [Trichoderma arundinaceum]|uniref:Uncharacterized protein n=1 Tax=Trichoderma arundinaceum TaxID=490622 RepID=A0A395NRD4_TRIAR|nr:hypothetical protein TARUN_3738 [Trichoderma arundinaceum]
MLFQKRTLHTDDARRYPPLTLRRDSLEAASLEAIRLGLATACRISVLTYTCLEFYLGRLRDKSICNPHHCGNRQYPLHIFLSNTTHSWTRSVGKPVRANYARSPSWVEEMRVARVLWMMQLVGELRHLAMRDPDALGWPQEDVEQAIGMMPEAFATSGDCYFVGMEEEAITVCEYLHTLDDEGDEFSQGRMESFYRLPRPPEIQTRSWTTQEPKPCMRKTTLGYVYDLGNRFIAATPPIERLELLIRPPPAKLPPVQGSWFSGQQSQEADRAGPGVEGYKQIAYDNWETPLSGVQFDSFRRLGFALWDDTRMRSLRLMDKYNWRLIGAPQIFVWRSLLSEEEIALAAVRFEPSNHGVDAE